MEEEGREGEWKRRGAVSLQMQHQFILSKSGAEAESLGGDAILKQQTSWSYCGPFHSISQALDNVLAVGNRDGELPTMGVIFHMVHMFPNCVNQAMSGGFQPIGAIQCSIFVVILQ